MSKRKRFEKRGFFRAVAWCLALGCVLCGAIMVAAHQKRKHFAREVQGRFDQLAKVEVGRTSRAEVLASIPGLKPVLATSGEFYVCNRNPDCVIVGTGSSRWLHWITHSNKLNWIVQKTHSGGAVGFIFRMAGLELGWTRLSLTFRDGRVEYWGYEIIATNHTEASIILRVVAAPKGATVFMEGRPHDENFDFWVGHIFDNWGDSTQKVIFAPGASEELKRVAMHPDLTCLQSYRGCETAKQLIPDALAADRQIREASVARLRGACSLSRAHTSIVRRSRLLDCDS
ncbi:MAG TPA: hypothetical protein VK684_04680 [Edaphobacter sp.]|nr:hypothetical protein [Edaphobacter sp.]